MSHLRTKMKKIILFSLGVVVLLAIFAGWFIHSKFHVVDHRPCIAVAERYYLALEQKSQERLHTFFSPEFLAENGDKWRRLLTGLNENYGPVTEVKLMEVQVVPVDQIGCSLLRYQVHRGPFTTQENIIFKPGKGGSAAIIGYEMIRLDTGQKIAAGVGVTERGFHVR